MGPGRISLVSQTVELPMFYSTRATHLLHKKKKYFPYLRSQRSITVNNICSRWIHRGPCIPFMFAANIYNLGMCMIHGTSHISDGFATQTSSSLDSDWLTFLDVFGSVPAFGTFFSFCVFPLSLYPTHSSYHLLHLHLLHHHLHLHLHSSSPCKQHFLIYLTLHPLLTHTSDTPCLQTTMDSQSGKPSS